MIDLKNATAGFVLAGSLGFAALGIGSGVAAAAPTPSSPSVQEISQEGPGSGRAEPSPYAPYGGESICGSPDLYFVNICN